jgi:hypothetical protein
MGASGLRFFRGDRTGAFLLGEFPVSCRPRCVRVDATTLEPGGDRAEIPPQDRRSLLSTEEKSP